MQIVYILSIFDRIDSRYTVNLLVRYQDVDRHNRQYNVFTFRTSVYFNPKSFKLILKGI